MRRVVLFLLVLTGCGVAPEAPIVIEAPDVWECDYLDPDGCVRHVDLRAEEHPDPPEQPEPFETWEWPEELTWLILSMEDAP